MIISNLKNALYVKKITGEEFNIVKDRYKEDRYVFVFKNTDHIFNTRNYIESLFKSDISIWEMEIRENIDREEIEEIKELILEKRLCRN